MSKEQLAGLVDQAAAALVQKWNLHEPDARRMATDVLATLPEPGVVATSDELAVTDGTHCVTCTCAPGMTPAVRFDASPAEREGAVREHLISMGWTPPEAAAPAGEVGFKAWVVEQMPAGTVIDNPAWWADRLAQAYAANVPQPPAEAQPVGAVRRDTGITITLDRLPYYKGVRLASGTKLYAHPPPSAPVGVEGVRREIQNALRELDAVMTAEDNTSDAVGCAELALQRALEALAQQPAAVDGDDFDCPHSAFDNCDCYADQQGGES